MHVSLRVGLLLLGLLAVGVPASARAEAPEPVSARAKVPELASARAEVPKIDLYTMGVGVDVTEKFGHAAICTRFSNPKRDRCYNYGTTNFEDPAAVGWSFLRGRSRFWVSVVSPQTMMDLYIQRDRSVWVQELELPEAQARAIAAKLHFDSLEANRYYRYHHYFDNCTTRIRDILDEHTGGLLNANADSSSGLTYRDLSRRGLAPSPLLVVLSDYVLGRVGDQAPTEYEAMFLPELFRESVRLRLGAEPVLIYERAGPGLSQEPGHGRLVMLILSLLLVIPIWLGFRKGAIGRRHLAPAVSVLVLLGLIVWGLALLCPLPMARYNEALLLVFPGDLALLLLRGRRCQIYARARVLICLLATAAAGIGILAQPLWAIAALPVLTLLPVALFREVESEPESADSEAESAA